MHRVLYSRHRRKPEEGLRDAQLTPDGEKKETEIATLLTLLAAVLILARAGLSLLWYHG